MKTLRERYNRINYVLEVFAVTVIILNLSACIKGENINVDNSPKENGLIYRLWVRELKQKYVFIMLRPNQ